MTSTLRPHARTGALSVLTAAAVTAALAAVPATAADTLRRCRHHRRIRVATHRSERALVTLVTGDRVVLRHDGQRAHDRVADAGLAALRPPVEHVAAGTHTWVVPKLAAVGAQPARPLPLRRLRPGGALRPGPADGDVRTRHLRP